MLKLNTTFTLLFKMFSKQNLLEINVTDMCLNFEPILNMNMTILNMNVNNNIKFQAVQSAVS